MHNYTTGTNHIKYHTNIHWDFNTTTTNYNWTWMSKAFSKGLGQIRESAHSVKLARWSLEKNSVRCTLQDECTSTNADMQCNPTSSLGSSLSHQLHYMATSCPKALILFLPFNTLSVIRFQYLVYVYVYVASVPKNPHHSISINVIIRYQVELHLYLIWHLKAHSSTKCIHWKKHF